MRITIYSNIFYALPLWRCKAGLALFFYFDILAVRKRARKKMFPTYSFSTSSTVKTGATPITYTLLSTTTDFHIIGVRMQQEKDLSETIIKCLYNGNNVTVAHNYAKDYPLDLLMFDCNGDVTVTKTGADEAFVTMTYLPDWAIPTATSTISSATTSTSTVPQYVNGFSYGDILIAFFLFILVTNQFFGGILNRLMGRKQKANYKIRL